LAQTCSSNYAWVDNLILWVRLFSPTSERVPSGVSMAQVAEQRSRPANIWRSWRGRLIRYAGIAASFYLGVIIVLLFLENWLLFHPVRATQEWLPPPNSRIEDVFFQSSDGNRLHAWWYPTPDWSAEKGALLYCHGNAGNLSHRADSIANWQKHLDIAVLIFDYPGYGRSEGKPSEAGCYAAGQAAYDWLVEQKHVSGEQILLYGGSLGGGVAVELASHRPHRALVLVKTFTSIPDAAQEIYPWLPARRLARNKFENLAKLGGCRQPVFIAHGTADRLIPFAHSERLFAAGNEPKKFYPMPGADHNEPLSRDFFLALGAFLRETATGSLGTPAPGATPVRMPAASAQN
jgi:uncharacterized protein